MKCQRKFYFYFILLAIGHAVFLNNGTASKYGISIVKINFAFSVFLLLCQNTLVIPF